MAASAGTLPHRGASRYGHEYHMRGTTAGRGVGGPMSIELLCLDADDTLWHNMRDFNSAETAFFTMMARFAEEAVARDLLEATSTANLRLYGYGAKSFTLSMIETATQLCGDSLTTATITAMLAAGRELLEHPVELLDGVGATLTALAAEVRLVLVTKGDLLHQETKLAASGLGDLFAGVEIVSDKKTETFARIFERYGVNPDRAGMVGDSIRSDVLPAIAAGAWAAFIPAELVWSHERAVLPNDHPRFAQLERFAELPAWLATVSGRPTVPTA